MTPWPTADVQSSYNHFPTMSPMQQSPDPFASYGDQQQQQAPAQQQQQQQQPGNADPWAAAMAMNQAPPAAAPAQVGEVTPPPAVVNYDASRQVPPSPIGDVSVIAAATAMHNSNAAPVVQLQPNPQPMMQPVLTQQPAPAAANPFDMGAVASSMPMAPAPSAMPPMAPPTPPQAELNASAPVGAAPQYAVSPPLSPAANSIAPQQGFADPFGVAFSPVTSPVTSPVASPNGSPGQYGAMVPSAAPNADPFGVAQAPPFMPGTQAPAQAMVPSAAPNADPFGVFGSQPAATAPADPFGGGALVSAPAPAGGAVDDPFGVFGSGPAPAAAAPAPTQAPPAPAQAAPVAQEEDPWAAAGFNDMVSKPQSQPMQQQQQSAPLGASDTSYNPANSTSTDKPDDTPITLDSNNLPSDGEYYEARINARSLGAMFYTARNLEETLYHKVPNNVIAALGSRPVVAFVAENSAASNAGVTLGHVVLSVNGHEICDPEYCANMIRNSPRPMNLRCYVPPALALTTNEGRHLVKYDTKDLEAPGTAMEWKRKYVVVGGIVTKPWMMNMFYRKRDYDIAVKEAHSGHKISVKVKQFDLRGARIILKGKDGKPNWVDYPSERKPWHYITILPNKGYPIKISAETLEELEPVYSAVRRFVRKDMAARYQYRMDETFGSVRERNGRNNSGRNASESSGNYGQFADAPVDSYWNGR